MRQLKFRIWDRQTKQFIHNSAGTHCASRWLIDAFTGRPVDFVVGFEDPEFGSLSEGEDYYMEGTKVVKEPRYVVQQFTGMIDKNGKDIYEGDLLRVSGEGWGRSPAMDYVSFYEGEYILPDLDVNCHNLELEVVGNNFENPEYGEMLHNSIESLIQGRASETINLSKYV